MSELTEYRVDGPVAIITLTNPPANTYSYAMMQALDGHILTARMDDAVHAIVLAGAGEKFFCAGADIGMLQTADPSFKYWFCIHANETLGRLEQTSKLVIAAIGGHCVGGGLEVAMAADLRIARRGAGKLGLPEVSLGVLPGTGGTQRLARLIGKSQAMQMMIESELVTPERAQALGLVNYLFDAETDEDFLAQVIAWARDRCPPKAASKAIGHVKRAVQTGLEVGFEQGLALERELQQRLFESEDAAEGIRAYNEKRAPVFKGR